MNVKLTEVQRELLSRLEDIDSSASTHWIRHWRGRVVPGAQARRALHRLAKLGLVLPQTSRAGLTFWWRLTDAGRAALNPTGEA
ncbi:hypothetical protein [Kaistia sp. UC242_56]|uniref:hypothetical protein n=1 Tax=Kaistia sp. UC242_56 TaxID=3374625 RepID=UPI0037AE5F3D